MKKLLLTKIRLSWYFLGFFGLYFVLVLLLPRVVFEGGTLALFSVNSFLYGFYVSPVLRSQKKRIDGMHKAVRAESTAVFAMMLSIKHLPEREKDAIKVQLEDYLQSTVNQKFVQAAKAYEGLIDYCVNYKGKYRDEVSELLEQLVDNQENRTDFHMELGNKIYSNEWMIMLVLFSITLAFVMLIDTADMLVIEVVTALLATGLSMLMVILVKLDSLTHKKARGTFQPFSTLLRSNFYQIDAPKEGL